MNIGRGLVYKDCDCDERVPMRFGDYVRSKKARMIRIEIYLKMIAYNLFFGLSGDSGHT